MPKKEIVATQNAPQAIGPYSQAVRSGGFLFCSGQIALDPKTGQMVGTDVETQTRQVMANIQGVLTAGGAALDQVIKTTIFLKSMGDFPKVNEIYGSFFKVEPPARSTVEVSKLPKEALVEIEVIAAL